MSFRANALWMTLSNFAYACAQWGFIVVLAKLSTPESLGAYALSLSIVSTTTSLTNGDLRAAITTDVSGKHRYENYICYRLITIVLSYLVILVLFSFDALGSALATAAAWTLLTVRSIEAVSDVFYGIFQKHEKMNLISTAITVRSISQTMVFALAIALTSDLIYATASLAVVSLLVLILYDLRNVLPLIRGQTSALFLMRLNLRQLVELAREVMPFCVQVCINTVTQNVPRFVLAMSVSEVEVGRFSSIAYFVVAGAIFVNALGQSALPRLAKLFAEDRLGYRNLAIKLMMTCVLFGVSVVGFVSFCGETLLVKVYSEAFVGTQRTFVLISIWAAILYFSAVCGTCLTAARAMKPQLVVNVLSLCALVVLSAPLVPLHGIVGAAYALVISSTLKLVGQLHLFLYLNRYSRKAE